ncbi:hypothetical protein HYT32_02625 [Candidatus Roizmanbacteria bacterium]|nr:hypothetical protein [Candidatus Roizmanbacteria bacterium]
MPKKTRRQKALSKERRIKFLLKQTAQQNEIPEEKVVEAAKIDPVTSDVSYFTSDLKRSLAYIAIVITLEIIVYFGTINR